MVPGLRRKFAILYSIPVTPKWTFKTEALLYAASRRPAPCRENPSPFSQRRYCYFRPFYRFFPRLSGSRQKASASKPSGTSTCSPSKEEVPDLTIFLDIDPELGLARINHRQFKDRLDQESLDFHQRVFSGYQLIKNQYQHRMAIFDATHTIEELTNEVYDYIIDWIARRESNTVD